MTPVLCPAVVPVNIDTIDWCKPPAGTMLFSLNDLGRE
jgi:hypothetical protein